MFGRRDYERALGPLLPQAGGYALSILRSRADAEDAVQTAALRGLERLPTYDEARPFKGWWFAILRNGCIDSLRRARRFPVAELDSEIAETLSIPAGTVMSRLHHARRTLAAALKEDVR